MEIDQSVKHPGADGRSAESAASSGSRTRAGLIALLMLLGSGLGMADAAAPQQGASAAPATQAAGDPVAQVEALEHDLIAVFNNDVAHHLDKVMEFFGDGQDILQFDLMTPREFDGPKAFRAHWAFLLSNYGDATVKLMDMRVHADNHLAFVSSIQRTVGKDPKGTPFDMTFRVTDCLLKTHGKWKIVHEHISFPIDMATGKADMHSQK